jgi:hypothetical protein
MSSIQEAERILKNPIGWIQLDLNFDLKVWQEESLAVKEHLVEHREGDGHRGWKSCCLHGISIEKTGHWSNYVNDEKDISYQWTWLKDKVPNIYNFWKTFPTEKYARLRFMELEPGGHIAPHNDSPNGLKNTDFNMMDHMIPINIAITHPEDCYMDLENYGRVPWNPGKAFIVNITDTHQVKNNSEYPRMHMIAHCIIGNQKEQFANLIMRSYNKFHENF